MTAEVKKHPAFIEALKKRGISDPTFLSCSALPPGYFATEEQRGKRIAHITCSDPRGVRNIWPRGISGLTVVVASSEIDELMLMCDRILVLCEGRAAGVLERAAFSAGQLVKLASP